MEIWELAKETTASEIGTVESATDQDQVREILDAIYDQEASEAGEVEVDSLVDVYNADLLDWVGSNLVHASFVEEAIYSGLADTTSFYKMLMAGQYEQYQLIAYEVFEWLQEQLEEIEEEEELDERDDPAHDAFVNSEVMDGNPSPYDRPDEQE